MNKNNNFNSNQKRRPIGTDGAGRWAPMQNPESGVDLSPGSSHRDSYLAAVAEGYRRMPRAPVRSAHQWWGWMKHESKDPRDGRRVDRDVPVFVSPRIPTVKKDDSVIYSAGSHRMWYTGDQSTLRCPSVASIKRFQRTQPTGAPFDVPVSAHFEGGQIDGFVRVMTDGEGNWSTMSIGFPDEQSATVAESVHCLLESRRPSRALEETVDLMERRRRRRAEMGTRLEPVTSGWIREMGYDPATGTMLMSVDAKEGRKNYAYSVPMVEYLRVAQDPAPGRVFNQRLRRTAPRVEARECSSCGNVFVTDRHRCPVEARVRGRHLTSAA